MRYNFHVAKRVHKIRTISQTSALLCGVTPAKDDGRCASSYRFVGEFLCLQISEAPSDAGHGTICCADRQEPAFPPTVIAVSPSYCLPRRLTCAAVLAPGSSQPFLNLIRFVACDRRCTSWRGGCSESCLQTLGNKQGWRIHSKLPGLLSKVSGCQKVGGQVRHSVVAHNLAG